MATFVCVHGAWGGGWEWAEVVRYLRAAGHEVYTPTLTGIGERSHLGTPQTDLETHIQDIVNLLAFEELRDVVLTGHSYGGVVITGVADRAPERLRQLVYLDALLPEDGESVFDLVGPEHAAEFEASASATGDGWRIPPLEWVNAPPVGDWARGRYLPHPLGTMRQPLRLANPAHPPLPTTFIRCTANQDTGELFDQMEDRARARGWHLRALPSIHDAQMAMPREVADLFLEALAQTG